MRTVVIRSFLSVLILGVAACDRGSAESGGPGESTPDPKGSPTPVAPSAEAGGEAALPAEAGAEAGPGNENAPTDAPAPCDAILEGMWTAAAGVLTRAGVSEVESRKEAYIRSGQSFVKRCTEHLNDEQRGCLQKAENPLEGMASCGITALPPRERPNPPDIIRGLDEAQPESSDEEKKALTARLVGSWRNEWASAKETTTWKIAGDGTLKESRIKRGGAPEERSYAAGPIDAYRLELDNQKGSRQTYAFFMHDKGSFYASSNLDYAAHPIPDRKDFRLRTGGALLLWKGEGCEVYGSAGAAGEATCEFEGSGNKETFTVSYSLPGQLDRDGQPRVTELSFAVVDGHLIDSRMKKFERR